MRLFFYWPSPALHQIGHPDLAEQSDLASVRWNTALASCMDAWAPGPLSGQRADRTYGRPRPPKKLDGLNLLEAPGVPFRGPRKKKRGTPGAAPKTATKRTPGSFQRVGSKGCASRRRMSQDRACNVRRLPGRSNANRRKYEWAV